MKVLLSLGAAVAGGIVPRGEVMLLAQRLDHVEDGVDVSGFQGIIHEGYPSKYAVVADCPFITC